VTEILQREETLDSCLLDGMETFPNGCNFRLVRKSGGATYLEYGCYGVHVNLVQGRQRLLMGWLEQNKDCDGRALLSNVKPETIRELRKRAPCDVCGGMRHDISVPQQVRQSA
jgi:hypothetical protein